MNTNKFITLTLAFLCVISLSAQQKLEKLSKSVNANKDVTLNLNTTHTNIEISTWDSNKIQVDAFVESNELSKEDLKGFGVNVFDGSMISVLGTSLQNKDVLSFFHDSTWNVIGLEMEGAHYQKAIQSASKIRGNISENVKVRYAYYASDNPLETGATLASGGLGMTGVTPTYAITQKILEQIF